MRKIPTLVDELRQLRKFLLSPTRTSMEACELLANEMAQQVGAVRAELQNVSEVKSLLTEIRLLLASAKSFWTLRQRATSPGQQYGSGGSMVPAIVDPSFAIEV